MRFCTTFLGGASQTGVLDVMKAALPWTGILFLFLIAITHIPEISLFLPRLLGA